MEMVLLSLMVRPMRGRTTSSTSGTKMYMEENIWEVSMPLS